ncbi:helicase-primase subunit [Equid gammaherpesvirus 2]|nr:helicase-primase subunit [Equid gammaherpesvirus 2]
MALSPVRVTEGKPLGVYFYNVWREARLVIWYVSYTPSGQTGALDFVFVVQEVCDEKWSALPASAGEASAVESGIHTILWERELRGHNEWIAALEGRGGEEFVFEADAGRVLTGLRVKGEEEGVGVGVGGGGGGGGEGEYSPETLRNAYFFSQSRQEFSGWGGDAGREEAGAPVSGKEKLWFRGMVEDMSVSDVDIVIRTARGVYSCPGGDGGEEGDGAEGGDGGVGGAGDGAGAGGGSSGKPPAGKRGRPTRLRITDLFRPVDCELAWRGRAVKLRPVLADFDVMWANPESAWNCCLPEFFRALLARTTRDFEGLPPALLYVFPAACREGSRFPPHFAGFPFFRVLFEPMRRVTADWLVAGDDRPPGGILLHHPPFFRSRLADRVLCPGLRGDEIVRRARAGGGNCWPLFATELNEGLCPEGRHDLLRVERAHALLTLDLARAACSMLGARVENPGEFLARVVETGSRDLLNAATSAYNLLLTGVLCWAAEAGFAWAAIDKSRVILVSEAEPPSEDAEEIEESLWASLGDHPPPCVGLVSGYGREDASVFLLWKSDRVLVGKSSNLSCPERRCGSWLESLDAALSLTLTEAPDPAGILRELMPSYHAHRHETKFWLVDRAFAAGRPERAPPLPVDCLRPAPYLLIGDGAVCWHEALDLPLDVDFAAYLSETLSCVSAALAPPGCGGEAGEGRNNTDHCLEEFKAVLSLL